MSGIQVGGVRLSRNLYRVRVRGVQVRARGLVKSLSWSLYRVRCIYLWDVRALKVLGTVPLVREIS